MKTYFIAGAVLFTLLFNNGCTTTEPEPTNAPIVGGWRVTLFMDGAEDLTSQFGDFIFTCTGFGLLAIGENEQFYYCSWSPNDETLINYHFQIIGCNDNSVLWKCNSDWNLTNFDDRHCYFSTYNSEYQRTMVWEKM